MIGEYGCDFHSLSTGCVYVLGMLDRALPKTADKTYTLETRSHIKHTHTGPVPV